MSVNEDTRLIKAIKLPHATAMVVGTIIGASIFVQPSEITGMVPSISGVFLVWLVSGVLTLFGALVCAELSSIFTKTGGVYIYLKEAYSPAVGFLWGWAMFWSMHSGIIAAVSVVFARYLDYMIPLGEWGMKFAAVAVIVIHSAINFLGVKQGSNLQTIFTAGKILAIVLIITLGFALGSSLPEHFDTGTLESPGTETGHFLLAMIAGLFAFGGWHMVTYNSGETINPKKTIPRALILGVGIVTVCYIALNAVYLYILPLDVLISSKRVAADAADVLIGSGGGMFLSALVMFSTFGAIGGIVLAGPRVYYAMSGDKLLFNWAGIVHPKYRTPHFAILLQCIWASILVFTGSYRVLFTRVIYTEWIFFGLMALAIFIFRRRGLKRE